MAATHAGMTTEEFSAIVGDWLATARHPRFDRPYTELAYQPMLELLAYLRERRLQDLHRLGRRGRVHARVRRAGLRHPARAGGRLLGRGEVRDGAGRQAGAAEGGRRSSSSTTAPASRSASTGSSGAARSWRSATPTAICRCCSGPPRATGPRFGLIVHHTDAEREWAYDRDCHIGRLDKALDEAGAAGWTVVDMKDDWNTIFAEAPK